MPEDGTELVGDRPARSRNPPDLLELVEVGANRVPGPQRLRNPVHHRRPLRLEGTEEPVPDDERPGEVPVLVLRVHPLMYPVVRWGVEHPLEGPQGPDLPGVDPEQIG